MHDVMVNLKRLPVLVTRKKIKNVRLRVFPSGEIRLSVPLRTPDNWIADFLKQKQPWIASKILTLEQTKPVEKEAAIRSGSSTRILGQELLIQVEPAKKKQVIREGEIIFIDTPDTEDSAGIKKQLDNWWQHSSKAYFTEVLDALYPIIGRHGIASPTVHVRKMHTQWGSCSRAKGRVNLNYYLYKAPPPCVEYVILHELTHFLYPGHQKDFYGFLTLHMPDWQERKKMLNREVVL